MEIVIKPVCSRSDLRKFIHLPAKIHKDHKNWIPPLYSDEWEYFSASKNKAYGYCNVILLLAFRGKKLVGRVMGIINYKYNDLHHQKHARFNYLETWDDREVISVLLQ
ncbi:MAG: N-acetyltransferase, partial [Bacteroidales bacterium]|nr:N-acetyltransferase [Bacteroidales bacterium]